MKKYSGNCEDYECIITSPASLEGKTTLFCVAIRHLPFSHDAKFSTNKQSKMLRLNTNARFTLANAILFWGSCRYTTAAFSLHTGGSGINGMNGINGRVNGLHSDSGGIGEGTLVPNALKPFNKLQNNFVSLRHGQSLANISKIISSRPSISTKKHGLSDLGKEQATNAAATLISQVIENGEEGSKGKVAIFSSDFKRARETAQIVADEMKEKGVELYKGDVILEQKLRERYFGTLNGGPDNRYPDVWRMDRRDPNHTVFNVESVNDVLRRVTNLVLDIDQELDPLDGSYTCILVAHGDVLQILQTGFEKIDGSMHRSLPHLETAVPRNLELTPEDFQ